MPRTYNYADSIIMINWNNYWKPTTKTMRAVGDTLLGVGTLASSYGIMEGEKDIAMLCLGSGVVGKFLTNFTKDEGRTTPADSGNMSDDNLPQS